MHAILTCEQYHNIEEKNLHIKHPILVHQRNYDQHIPLKHICNIDL
jgi:hypothetical protein